MTTEAWLQKHTKSVLHDCVITVMGTKVDSNSESAPIKMSVHVVEVDYGPCLYWKLTVDVPCERGWVWDEHPLLLCRAMGEKEKGRTDAVSSAGEILDDTPAIRALLAELCDPAPRELYVGTDCGHRAKLVKALEMFWS